MLFTVRSKAEEASACCTSGVEGGSVGRGWSTTTSSVVVAVHDNRAAKLLVACNAVAVQHAAQCTVPAFVVIASTDIPRIQSRRSQAHIIMCSA